MQSGSERWDTLNISIRGFPRNGTIWIECRSLAARHVGGHKPVSHRRGSFNSFGTRSSLALGPVALKADD